MSNSPRNTTEQILDLLLDALQERQKAREGGQRMKDEGGRMKAEDLTAESAEQRERRELASLHRNKTEETAAAAPTVPASRITPQPALPPERLPSIQLDQMLGRLLIVLAALVVIINIPFNRHGTNLARAAPDSAALVIRDGLLLKGSGPEVYVLQDERLRWITTIDAFQWYGYRWEQVHQVEDEFLADFEAGLPIHLLLKCPASPHVYALEDGRKRWIKDIPTFEAQQYVWEEIRPMDCASLRNLPDGPPIPEDAGPPPQP
jgi:hypothetical protein